MTDFTRIQVRRDSASDWTSADPTLFAGEIGYEEDTGRMKVGDGSTAWSSKAYHLTPGILDNATTTQLTLSDTTATFAGDLTIAAGKEYQINGVSKLTATGLGSLVVGSSLTSVGALNSGSITSGFGAIDNGASNITTTGIISGGTLTDGTISITGGSLTGATGITATNLTGTLQTAAQPNVTSVGTLTSLAVTGDLTVDTSTLYVDSTNNRVGVGTTSPIAPLEVGTGAGFYISSITNTIGFGGNQDIDNYSGWINYRGYADGATRYRDLSIGDGKQGIIAFFDGSSGKVGIGTVSPLTGLHVNSTTAKSRDYS